jgi:hypothetical protein
MKPVIKRLLTTVIGVAAMSLLPVTMVVADETCNSPYMTRIITRMDAWRKRDGRWVG